MSNCYNGNMVNNNNNIDLTWSSLIEEEGGEKNIDNPNQFHRFYLEQDKKFTSIKRIFNPSLPSFCLLLKIIMRHPYLKILDLVNLLVANAPMKKKSRNLVLPPSQSTLKYGSENRP